MSKQSKKSKSVHYKYKGHKSQLMVNIYISHNYDNFLKHKIIQEIKTNIEIYQKDITRPHTKKTIKFFKSYSAFLIFTYIISYNPTITPFSFFFFFCLFLGPHLWNTEIPWIGLRVESELKLEPMPQPLQHWIPDVSGSLQQKAACSNKQLAATLDH